MQDTEKTYQTALYLKKIVIADAESRAADIVAEAKAAEKAAVRAAKLKARTEAQKLETERKAAIKARSQNAISDYEADCKKRLMDERSRIRAEVESRLKERLAAFSATAEYGKLLTKKLSELSEKLGDDVCAEYAGDAAKSALAAVLPRAEAKESARITLGGCVVTDRESGIEYDLTLDAGFESAAERFPEISGLEITER